MKLCRHKLCNKIMFVVGTVLFVGIALFMFCVAILSLIMLFCSQSSVYSIAILSSCLYFAIGSACVWIVYKFSTFERRRYSVSEAGLTLSDRGKNLYKWSEINEISIAAYAASASGENYNSVLCVFLKPRSEEFLKKILRSYKWAVNNQKNFVIIDYSPEIAAEFAEFYQGEIMDYRGTQLR